MLLLLSLYFVAFAHFYEKYQVLYEIFYFCSSIAGSVILRYFYVLHNHCFFNIYQTYTHQYIHLYMFMYAVCESVCKLCNDAQRFLYWILNVRLGFYIIIPTRPWRIVQTENAKKKNEKHGHEQQLQEKKLYRTLNNNPTGHTKTLSFHIFIWFWTSHQKNIELQKKHKVKNIKTWQLYKWTWQELWELWNLHSSRVLSL